MSGLSNISSSQQTGIIYQNREQIEFGAALDIWINQGPYDEKVGRTEAVCRIRQAINVEQTTLDLSDLGLSSLPPIMSHLTHLISLDIHGNRLEVFPLDICRLTHIETLNISSNPLKDLPDDLGNLHDLRFFNFEHTKVKEITPSLETFFVMKLCKFTYKECKYFFNDNMIWREIFYSSVLLVGAWKNFILEYKSAFPEANLITEKALYYSLCKVRSESIVLLQRFFCRVSEIADYQQASTHLNALVRIHKIIEGLVNNKDFFEHIISILASHENHCGDQVGTAFAQIEQQYPLYCLQENMSSLIKRIVGLEREQRVEKWARAFALKVGSQEEELEFVLAFKLELKKYLSLPFETQGMLHRDYVETVVDRQKLSLLNEIATCGATILLNTASQESHLEILMKNSLWRERMKKDCAEQIESFQNDIGEYWINFDPKTLEKFGIEIEGKTNQELNKMAEKLLSQKVELLILERTQHILSNAS